MTFFSGIKKSLSRRSSNPFSSSSSKSASKSSSSHLAPTKEQLFTDASPSTRRPGKSSYTSHPALGIDSFTDGSSTNPFASSEDPPPYTTSTVSDLDNAAAPIAPPLVEGEADDPYAFLRTFDTIFLIDDSGSMIGRNWRETGKALELITPICTARDADGIDIYFLNCPDSPTYRNVNSAGRVGNIFQSVRPGGGTPTGQRLRKILIPYLARFEATPSTTKPVNLIVITDGAPSDDVESSIVEVAEGLDRLNAPAWQIGIQFFQVGKDADARNHLKYMDDGLVDQRGNRIRDIVDTVPFTGAQNQELTAKGVMKVILGSVNRRLDRNSADLHRRS
ncbi:hypothetical protein K504DRAFT_365965 [Pleomassaria siparia CBS 279.74]|uniref:VWFA domain-containing protein n=1 Tax=Pleomassaria siparia CBS 279.74 TaxID=1314801 RepID=A0A6G1KST5_9PLEO|nr:hypothetical protein K504DRAFT_365965 [Pleomassaria siparia CBS 279.74]